VLFLSLYNAFAICAFLGESAFGRPPSRPRARAAVRPAWVRSRMMSRSNSASAPKMWKMSFPPDVVVSIASISTSWRMGLLSRNLPAGGGLRSRSADCYSFPERAIFSTRLEPAISFTPARFGFAAALVAVSRPVRSWSRKRAAIGSLPSAKRPLRGLQLRNSDSAYLVTNII
jgi:hypothetical protein